MLSDVRFSKHAAWGRFKNTPVDVLTAVKTSAFAFGLMAKTAEIRHEKGLLTQDEYDVVADIVKTIKVARQLVNRVSNTTVKVASADLDTVIAQEAILGGASMDKIAAGPADLLGGGGAVAQELPPALMELLKKILGQGGVGGMPGMPGAEGDESGDEAGAEGGQPGGPPGADQMPAMMQGGAPGAGGGMDEQMLAELMKKMQMPKGASADDDHVSLLTKALQTPAAQLGLPRVLVTKTASKVVAPLNKLADCGPESMGAVNSFQRTVDYLGVPPANSTYIGRGPVGGLNVGLLSLLPAA